MTAVQIAIAYLGKPQTPERLQKAQRRAQESQIPWSEVEAEIAAQNRGDRATVEPQ